MRPLLVFPLLLALSACSLAGPSDSDIEDARDPNAEGVIVNRAEADLTVLAVSPEVAAVINIASEYEVDDREAIVRRGEAAPLSIEGHEDGQDFIVFVFRVDGRRATYTRSIRVDGGTFSSDDELLTVRRL